MLKSAVKFSKEQIEALKEIAFEKKLKGAEVLNEYTDDEIAESFNGAGSCSEPEWKRYILTKILENRLPAIMIHDVKYRKGGSDEDFARVNDELEENIKALGDKSTWWDFVGRKAKEYSNEYGRPGWGVA